MQSQVELRYLNVKLAGMQVSFCLCLFFFLNKNYRVWERRALEVHLFEQDRVWGSSTQLLRILSMTNQSQPHMPPSRGGTLHSAHETHPRCPCITMYTRRGNTVWVSGVWKVTRSSSPGTRQSVSCSKFSFPNPFWLWTGYTSAWVVRWGWEEFLRTQCDCLLSPERQVCEAHESCLRIGLGRELRPEVRF